MPILRVALDLPLHRLFEYRIETASPDDVGRRVRVPFGKAERIGVVLGVAEQAEWPEGQLRDASALLFDLPPLPADFLRLCTFAAQYYQASLGEAILQALPSGLKRPVVPARRAGRVVPAVSPLPAPPLTDEQQQAIDAVRAVDGFACFLLFGVTGSGKTEVYLRLIETVLQRGQQALVLVPEINLTPQLEARVRGRFSEANVVTLHSDLSEAARERSWRAACVGQADIVLGTRLAVFTPLPRLGLIVVDEEHDASFKQQDGMRYSARDIAVFRARDRQLPIVLGSATPALETWANAAQGRYGKLSLLQRANPAATLPSVDLLDTRKMNMTEGLSPPLRAAIEARLARGEQSLLFLNRRGYAPVLACTACGWISGCMRCAAHLVVHLGDRRLRCHHCGAEQRLPRACPCCGNQDIQPFGRGTQRLEAHLQAEFPEARIIRVDRDSVKSRRQWEQVLAKIHGGEADILVGTQMLAKGHDFPRLTLVGVLGADAALFAADWRAPERLFAQLMQVAGRAGRAELKGQVMIQTQYPDHPLYAALIDQDYPAYAATLLAERESAQFPPFSFQAVLRAEAKEMPRALEFLSGARDLPVVAEHPAVCLYDPVPMKLFRLAGQERAQLLVECPSRPALQAFLPRWRQAVEGLPGAARLRWHIEVDPFEL